MQADQTVFDISVTLGEEAIHYPGDTPYARHLLWEIDQGGAYNLSSLELSAHAGTHIDAPAHFLAAGKTLDQYAIQDFILPALVADVQDARIIGPRELSGLTVQPGDALLLRTENSTSGRCRTGVFSRQYVHLSPEGALYCAEKKIALAGIDYISMDADGVFDAHRTLLTAGILILEGINLAGVPAGRYTLYCFPLKMKGAEASPVRAVLIRQNEG